MQCGTVLLTLIVAVVVVVACCVVLCKENIFKFSQKSKKNYTVNISDRSCKHRHTISQTTHEQVQKKPVDEVDNVFQDADFPRQYKIKK